MKIRPAVKEEIPALEALIAESARGLSGMEYSDGEIEAAVRHVFGVDTELLEDKSYFVVESEGRIAACGGWSRRQTLFGGDRYEGRRSGLLDPAKDAAKIRAFFVHPDFARKGIGTALLNHCEKAAKAHGFSKAELMATLPGVKLYAALGYVPGPVEVHTMPDDSTVRFVPMRKEL